MLVKTLLLMVARPCHEINNVRGGPNQRQSAAGDSAMGCRLVLRKTLSLSLPYRIASHFITYESSQKSYGRKEHSF